MKNLLVFMVLGIFSFFFSPKPDQTEAFKFSVDDIFRLSTGQLVVSGQVKSGEISIKEKLKISIDNEEKVLVIEKMEIFAKPKQKNVVYKDDYVAFTISGLSKSDLKRGDIFTK